MMELLLSLAVYELRLSVDKLVGRGVSLAHGWDGGWGRRNLLACSLQHASKMLHTGQTFIRRLYILLVLSRTIILST